MKPKERILLETDTELEHYQVVERVYEGRPARVLFSGSQRAAQSGVGLDDDPDLLFDYNQRLLEIANAVYPRRVLVIGGGAFTLPQALLTALPEARIDVVELDPGLEAIARQYFGLEDNDRLNIIYGDGRTYIEKTRQVYDLIILDVFSELSIPRQFLTLEFVARLRKRLAKGGCVALNIIASYQGKNAGLIRSQVAAYRSLFEGIDIFPAAYGLTSWLPQNLLLVAQTGGHHDLSPYVRFAPIDLPEAQVEDIVSDTSI